MPAPGVGSVGDMKNVMRKAPAGAGPWLRTLFVIVSGRLVAPLAGTVTAVTTRSGSKSVTPIGVDPVSPLFVSSSSTTASPLSAIADRK